MEEPNSGSEFWINRWERERESYVPGAISLYRGNLRALRRLLSKHRLTPAQWTPPGPNHNGFARGSVLDVSSGRGFWATFYRKLGVPLVACSDVSPWVVEQLREKGFLAWEWDIGKTPFPAYFCFSWIHCTQTLVHLVEEEKFERACKYLAGVVAPGGYLLVGDRFLPDCKINKPHIKYREVGKYILSLTQHDLTLIDVVPSFPLMGRLLLFTKRA